MQCVHAITVWASSEDMHQSWQAYEEHAPSEKATGDDVKCERHVPDDADDGSDHGASYSDQGAGCAAGTQGKRKRDGAAESSSAGGKSPRIKKASIPLSSVFQNISRCSTPAAAMAGTEGRSAHPSDLGASAAAFCLADICGVVGKGASGQVFAARYAQVCGDSNA